MRSPSCSSRSGLCLLALLLVGTAACSDSGSDLPLDAAPAPIFQLTPLQESGFAAALEDVRVRLLPGLPDRGGRLAKALDELSLALSTRDAFLLRQALRQAEAALAALPASEEEAAALAAELDAVRLLLSESEQVTRPVLR